MPLLITKNKDLGLLILRIGVGLSMMIFHGFGKLKGGPELWEKIGGNMATLESIFSLYSGDLWLLFQNFSLRFS